MFYNKKPNMCFLVLSLVRVFLADASQCPISLNLPYFQILLHDIQLWIYLDSSPAFRRFFLSILFNKRFLSISSVNKYTSGIRGCYTVMEKKTSHRRLKTVEALWKTSVGAMRVCESRAWPSRPWCTCRARRKRGCYLSVEGFPEAVESGLFPLPVALCLLCLHSWLFLAI